MIQASVSIMNFTINDPEIIDFLTNDIKMNPETLIRSIMSFVKSLKVQYNDGAAVQQLADIIKCSLLNPEFSTRVSESVVEKIKSTKEPDNYAPLANEIVNKIKEVSNTPQTGILREIGELQGIIGMLKNNYSQNSKTIEKVVQLCENTHADLQKHLQRYDSRGGSIIKGKTAERDLFLQLQKHFVDYEITNVSGVGGQMDFILHTPKVGTPIGIECKADDYGNVGNGEVKRFIQNVTDTGRHGIMVSLYNGISGYKNMDIHITSNNRIAMFITENKYNMQDIEEAVRIITCLNEFIDKIPAEEEGIKLTTNKVESIRRMVAFWENEIKEVKKHLKIASDQINNLKVSNLLELILAEVSEKDDKTFICPFSVGCKKKFNIQESDGSVKGKGLGGLRKHLNSCNFKSDSFFCSICKSNFEKYDVLKFMTHIKSSHQK